MTTDCRVHKVVVKGQKVAEDPMKVVERVQRKTRRKVELLTPLPPPKPEKKEKEKMEEEKPKVEEKKEKVYNISLSKYLYFAFRKSSDLNASVLFFSAASNCSGSQSSYALRGLRTSDQEENTKDERFSCFYIFQLFLACRFIC